MGGGKGGADALSLSLLRLLGCPRGPPITSATGRVLGALLSSLHCPVFVSHLSLRAMGFEGGGGVGGWWGEDGGGWGWGVECLGGVGGLLGCCGVCVGVCFFFFGCFFVLFFCFFIFFYYFFFFFFFFFIAANVPKRIRKLVAHRLAGEGNLGYDGLADRNDHG